MSVLLLLLLPSVLLVLCCASTVFYTIWWKPKALEKSLRKQGIHGAPYKLFYGDLKELGRSIKEAWSKPMNLTHDIAPRVMPFPLQTLRTYGKICVFWSGSTAKIIVQDPELMKEILSNKSGNIQKPPVMPLVGTLTMGLANLEREKWAKHRRIVSPAFHLQKVQQMAPAITLSCTELIERWNDMVSSHGGSHEVDIWPEFENFTAAVISRTAFGSSLEEGKRIFQLQKEQAKLVMEARQSVYIPGFRYLPTKKNRRRMYLHKEVTAKLRELINKKQRMMRSGESSSEDVLGLLLRCASLQADVSDSKSNDNQMTIEEVIEECKLFYFAGQETSATLLTWTMIVLAMHPEWQNKSREEVLQICGKNPPKIEEINHFKIVTMVLYETLRLYPAIVQQVRHTSKKTKIGDSIYLPAGVELVLPTLLINRDPEFWGDDALEFKPERFSEGASKATKDKLAFFPFGWGPRICLGQNLAMEEAKIALATILQNFSFELSQSYTHAPYTIVTLQPQHGAPLILQRL